MMDEITDNDLRSLLRDSLSQALDFANRLPITPNVASATLHIEHAISEMKKEMEYG